jgi:hypothetical protein
MNNNKLCVAKKENTLDLTPLNCSRLLIINNKCEHLRIFHGTQGFHRKHFINNYLKVFIHFVNPFLHATDVMSAVPGRMSQIVRDSNGDTTEAMMPHYHNYYTLIVLDILNCLKCT